MPIAQGLALGPHSIRIVVGTNFRGVFNYDTIAELTAVMVVWHEQKATGLFRDEWKPFTREQFEETVIACTNRERADLDLEKLLTNGMLVEQDGQLYVTEEFVRRCYRASPMGY